jgi:hypothetical protein
LFLNLFSAIEVENGIPTVIVVLLMFGGVQLFCLGLIGEYVLSIHSQVKRKPSVFDL